MMGEEMTGNEPGPPVFPPPSIESEGRREREVWPPKWGELLERDKKIY